MATECCWVCPCETFVACCPHYASLAEPLLWPARCQSPAPQLAIGRFYWTAFAFYHPFCHRNVLVWIRATGPPPPESSPQLSSHGVEEAEGDVGQV